MSQSTGTDHRRQSPRRSHGLAVSGGVFALLLVVVGGAVLLSLSHMLRPAHHDSVSHRHADVRRLTVSSERSVDVSVQATSDSTVTVTGELTWDRVRPTVDAHDSGGELRISAACPRHGALGFSPCGVKLSIRVPSTVPVTLRVGSGNVLVGALSGGVHATVSSGDLRFTGTGGEITADVDSGNLDASGLRTGTVTTTVESGDTALSFATAPRRLRVRADSGNVRLRVPHVDGGYRVRADTADGDRRVRVAGSRRADHRIEADVDSGGLDVGYSD